MLVDRRTHLCVRVADITQVLHRIDGLIKYYGTGPYIHIKTDNYHYLHDAYVCWQGMAGLEDDDVDDGGGDAPASGGGGGRLGKRLRAATLADDDDDEAGEGGKAQPADSGDAFLRDLEDPTVSNREG